MLEFLIKEANKTYTENMAITHLSTLSDCLDLFATVGALRNSTDDEIENRFMRAYTENPDIAMKLAFFVGAIIHSTTRNSLQKHCSNTTRRLRETMVYATRIFSPVRRQAKRSLIPVR
jgi:hypothetical protein